MKSYSLPNELDSRNERIDRAILELYPSRKDVDAEKLRNLPLVEKEKIYFETIDRIEALQRLEELRSSLQAQRRLVDAGFPKFCELPKELREQVYVEVIADYGQGRTHIVTKKNGRFISNQDISPLMSVCSESRSTCLRSGLEFAYGTSINFDIDVIYIRPFTNALGYGPWYDPGDGGMDHHCYTLEDEEAYDPASDFDSDSEDDETEESDAQSATARGPTHAELATKTFLSFLDDPSTVKIKRLAMTLDFFCAMPSNDIPWVTNYTMRKRMPKWKEVLIVMNDDARNSNAAWKEKEVSFREARTREKNVRGHGSNLRAIRRRVEYMAIPESENVKFEFEVDWRRVFLEEKDEDEGVVPASVEEIEVMIEMIQAAASGDQLW